MSKITAILGSSVIKKQRATESPKTNKSLPRPLADDIQYLSSRCIACMCPCTLKAQATGIEFLFLHIFCLSWGKIDDPSSLATCKSIIGTLHIRWTIFTTSKLSIYFITFSWYYIWIWSHPLRTNNNLPSQTMFNRKFKTGITEKWRI